MPKPSAITQAVVDEIALALLSQGLTPSVNLVQAELKKHQGSAGGTQVVTRLLADWRGRAAQALGPKMRPGISEALSAIADQFIAESVKHAEKLLQDEAEEIRRNGEEFKAACTLEVEKANAAIAEIKSILGETAAKLQTREAEIGSISALNSEMNERIATLSADLESTRELLAQSSGVIQQLKEDAVSSENRHLELQAQQKVDCERQISTLQSAQADEIRRLSEKYSEDMEREREVREGERKRIYQEIDSIREASKREREKTSASIESARRETDASKTLAESYRSQNEATQKRNAYLEGSMKAMESELERLRLEVDALRSPEKQETQPEEPLAQENRSQENIK